MSGDCPSPDLETIRRIEYGSWRAGVLNAALQLDLFSGLKERPCDARALAVHLVADECATGILCDALCALGLLAKDSAGMYALTSVSDAYLVRGKSTFYGDYCVDTQLAWAERGRLADAVRTGRPIGALALGLNVEDSAAGPIWAQRAAPYLLAWPYKVHRARSLWALAAQSGGKRSWGRICDIGCGDAVMSLTAALDDKRVHVSAVDYPEVLSVAESIAASMGVADRFRLLPGDIRQVGLGAAQYDTALMGSVLFYLDATETQAVLSRVYHALRPNGVLVIESALPDEARCEVEEALVGATQLLLFTNRRNVLTLSEYQSVLTESRFENITKCGDNLVLAQKTGAR